MTCGDYSPVGRSRVCLCVFRQVQVEGLRVDFFKTQTAAAPVPVWNNICAAVWVLKRLHAFPAALPLYQLGLNLLLGSACLLEILGQALEPPPPPIPPRHTPAWLSLASKGGWCTFRKKHTNMEAVGVQVYRPCSYDFQWVQNLSPGNTFGISMFLPRICVLNTTLCVCEECVQS